MGTDIHLYAEVKIAGTWYTYSNIDLGQDYKLFALMAGVRSDKEWLFDVKGLPDDMAVVTKIAYEHESQYCCAVHHQSWLSAEEIWQLWREYPDAFDNLQIHGLGYLVGNGYEGFYTRPVDGTSTAYPDKFEDLRWVFWFDN